MRMSLGKRADYAIRAVLYLTRHQADHQWHKARRIAADMEVPEKYLPQVMAALVHTGSIESEPGPGGGYRLAVDSEKLTLLEVIEAVEPPIVSGECILRGGPCRWEDSCAVHHSWTEAQEALRQRLQATSFAELALIDAGLDTSRP